MRVFAIALVWVTSPAIAGDFRVADFGDPCSSIRKLEAALGSTEIPRSGVSDYFEFRDEVFKREVRVIYNCQDGKLLTGHTSFPSEEKDQAVETFKAAYNGLVAMYGLPVNDNTPWQAASLATERHRIATDPATYYASWTTGRALTIASMVGDETDHKWQVQVDVAPPPTY